MSHSVDTTDASLRNRCIVIVNGGSGVGKSTIAGALAQAIGVESVVSTDLVREGMRASLADSDVRAKILAVSSYLAHSLISESERSGNFLQDVVAGYEKQSDALLEAINRIVNRIQAKGAPAIIEGVNLVTAQLLRRCPPDLANILIVNLHLSTEKEHLARLHQRSDKYSLTPEQAYKPIGHIKQIRIIDTYLYHDAVTAALHHDHVISIENSGTKADTVRTILMQLKKVGMLQTKAD